MADHLEALNTGLAQLHAAVGTDPVVADRTRFCLIGFAGAAEVLQPLCRPSDVVDLTDLTTRAATSFGAAFTLLRATIERDLDALRAQSHQVFRPAVFFLSDGHPTDPATWPAAHRRLVARDWAPRPDIVAFGIGDADPATIARVGTVRAFMSRGGVRPDEALHGFTRALTRSLVRAGQGSPDDDGEPVLRVPAEVEGFAALRVDPL